jgi:hypothetical protein
MRSANPAKVCRVEMDAIFYFPAGCSDFYLAGVSSRFWMPEAECRRLESGNGWGEAPCSPAVAGLLGTTTLAGSSISGHSANRIRHFST